ncbi:MAG: hypothetical protein GY711_01220 [bacterium]|nr:hypothetical protein [bacterium]
MTRTRSLARSPTHLHIGGNVRRGIEAGIRRSDFGVVILSPRYFVKTWTQTKAQLYTSVMHALTTPHQELARLAEIVDANYAFEGE